MKKYGMVYLISKENKQVLLIRKLKPSFLAGKLTAIGGNFEEEDLIIENCVIREVKEEANINLTLDQLVFLEREVKSKEFDLTTFYCFISEDQMKQRKNMIDEIHDWFDLMEALNRDDLARNVKEHLNYILNI